MTLTDILAIYAAGLSTLIFFWNVRSARANLRTRIVHTTKQNDDGSYEHGLRIEVQNPSLHKAHLNAVVLVYPFRKPPLKEVIQHIIKIRRLPTRQGWIHTHLSNYEVEDDCPISIEPHKSHSIFVPKTVLDDIEEAAIRPVIKVMVQDALWRNRYSREFKLR